MSDTPDHTEHKPFVPPEKTIPELTIPAVTMGAILGIIFAASSTYLGLKVGLTVSASIPVAVLSITLFRWLKLRGTILENNIAQTTGSAGESLAAGVAFTLPSLLLMGFEVELLRVLLVALLGGLIGVLMMIPLRHGLIVKEHGKLTYPEGTACADVLIVGEKGGTDAKNVFLGFFVGLFYAIANLINKLWSDTAQFSSNVGGYLKKTSMAFEVSPPMLGVGYIIGPKVSANMLAGGMLGFLVLIPLIATFGPASVADMSPGDIRHDYVLYIGAGAVAAGGFIALGRSIPTIISAFRRGLGSMKKDDGGAKVVGNDKVLRTERDLPMTVVLGGSAALAVAIFAAPILDIDFLTALLVVVFGFFFVTVSSRITGEIGSSSNPISGMTIATLLLTCGLFVLIGRTGVGYKAMALSTAALVCVAASNGGTISQDLKTGYLVGATPRLQQISIAVGVVTSAIVIGFVMLLFLGTRNTYQAVVHPGIKLAVTGETAKGPDGNTYKIGWERDTVKDEKGAAVARGKYLVDDSGEPYFFVSTSVDQGYPWKLKKVDSQLPAGVKLEGKKLIQLVPASHPGVALPPIATTATGPDGKSYRVAVSEGAHESGKETVPAGTYLVDDAGVPRFFVHESTEPMTAAALGRAKPTAVDLPASQLAPRSDAETGPDGAAYRVAIVEDRDPAVAGKGVANGTYLIDAAGDAKFKKSNVGTVTGSDLGLDRKPYHVVTTDGVGNLGEGRYLIDDGMHVGFETLKATKFDAPKAQLFALIIDGTLGGNLPWGLVLIGVFIAIILELVGVSSLPFAVGLYLPISTSGGIFVGGAVRWLVDRKRRGESEASAEFSPGMLMASGLIAGGSIAGVVQAGLLQFEVDDKFDFSKYIPFASNVTWWPMFFFAAMAAGLYYVGTRNEKGGALPTAEVVDKH